ncbi:MAG: hypothetical protein ACL93V_17230 [Candidatus Electrothrix sp. YB6]
MIHPKHSAEAFEQLIGRLERYPGWSATGLQGVRNRPKSSRPDPPGGLAERGDPEPAVCGKWAAAERMIRFDVLWRKRSQGTNSDKRNQRVERILSLRQTCRLRGRSTFEVLTDAVRCCFRGQKSDSQPA